MECVDLLSSDVNTVLAASDFLVNTLPSTPATRGLLSGGALAACGANTRAHNTCSYARSQLATHVYHRAIQPHNHTGALICELTVCKCHARPVLTPRLCLPARLPACLVSRTRTCAWPPVSIHTAASVDRAQPTTFINVGRGDIMAEEDIIAALEAGWISQAVLDVFPVEPLPESSPVCPPPPLVPPPPAPMSPSSGPLRLLSCSVSFLAYLTSRRPARRTSRCASRRTSRHTSRHAAPSPPPPPTSA